MQADKIKNFLQLHCSVNIIKQHSGKVEERLPNTIFRVRLEHDHVILATFCGKMRKARIWVNVGEKVHVEMTPYDLDKGRITFVERTHATDSVPNHK